MHKISVNWSTVRGEKEPVYSVNWSTVRGEKEPVYSVPSPRDKEPLSE